MSGKAPEGRCGFTTDIPAFGGPAPNVTCWREAWRDHERCIWHADVDEKPVAGLAAERADTWERLDGAVLRETNLGDTISFADCWLIVADFSGANLGRTDFTDTDLRGANFIRADLTGTMFNNANLREVTFTNANLKQADFIESFLPSAFFINANLSAVDLSEAFLYNVDLTDADLTDADLTDANLQKADLQEADLQGADLTNADLQEADLVGASLTDADLTDANASTTSFNTATMESADLTRTDLRGASLDTTGLYQVQFADVRLNNQTDFGDECSYDAEDRSPESVPHVPPLEAAAWVYRKLQTLYEENAMTAESRRYHVQKKEVRRTRMQREGQRLRWLGLTGSRWVTKHGESPWHVVGTSAVVVAVCTLLYPLLGGVAITPDGTPMRLFNPLEVPLNELPGGTWLANFYFSLVTFTTLGYGDIQPASAPAQLLAGIESFIGAALMALLVAVLSRRISH